MRKVLTSLALAVPLAFAAAVPSHAEQRNHDGLRVMTGILMAAGYGQSSYGRNNPAPVQYWDRREVKTIGNVVRKLEEHGGKVVSIEARGRDYQIIGYNTQGRLVTGRVDGATAKILNIVPYGGRGFFNKRAVSITRVMQNLRREGITDVRKVVLDGRIYRVEAESRRGRDFSVIVNARSGRIDYVRRAQTGGYDTHWN